MAFRTDLALEAYEALSNEQEHEMIVEEEEVNEFTVKKISVNQAASVLTGKKVGDYWTFEAPQLRTQNEEWVEKASTALSYVIRSFLEKQNISEDAPVLIAGLGNWQITPDALGPDTCRKVFVTNHLFEVEPNAVSGGFRRTAALAPGVMGLTGMETAATLKGVIDQYKPEAVIVIDALAARSAARLHTTVQISSAGINPGAGVGNNRQEINRELFGVPVIAIGIPTVVDAASITQDTLGFFEKTIKMKSKKQSNPSSLLMTKPSVEELNKNEAAPEEKSAYLGLIGELSEEEKQQLFKEILSPIGQNLIVTPKETDLYIKQASDMLASALDHALHHPEETF
ncbi:GPR endopeptidase [Jeotgalibacillus haloalkalitolerans]|uniref:Germination protease n=1 Tax=Jeotgalibacillus haloalkalitolerans TaxID=3104292 RepID=A0ABU5KLZ4_9BACL|nr:GPR endopeptidase [Jeotgalibacillus sp. HH7-29]MDZ5712283.1 GPR endopeptidase [Jeotgalibacillus sp. HH7-29]